MLVFLIYYMTDIINGRVRVEEVVEVKIVKLLKIAEVGKVAKVVVGEVVSHVIQTSST